MDNQIDMSDVIFKVNGKEVANLQAIEATYEAQDEGNEFKNGDNLRLYNNQYSFTMKNVQINPDYINKIRSLDSHYTILMTGYDLPRGKRLPKKKRIRNKWIKKYGRAVTYENCVIR